MVVGSTFLSGGLVRPAHATSVIHLTSVEQAALSHAIVEATVGTKDTMVFTDGRIYTDTTLHITNVINGEAPEVLNVRQSGGEHDGLIEQVAGDGRLDTGSRVVAMIRKVEGVWYLTAMAQSVWHVEGHGSTASVTRDVLGLGLYQDTSAGTKPLDETPLEFAFLGELRTALSHVPLEPTP